MDIRPFIKTPCTITRRSQDGPPDDFGTPTFQTTETSALVAIFPVSTEELEDRPSGKFTHQAFLLPTVEIGHQDSIEADGSSWEVDGPARTWTHPVSLEDVYQQVDLVGYTP